MSSGSSSSHEAVDFGLVAAQFVKQTQLCDDLGAQHLVRRYGLHWSDSKGEGPLHMAARANRAGLMAWLLSQNDAPAVLDWRNARGETPLLLATRLCRGCVALRLVEALADPGAADAEGEAPEGLDLDGLLREAERDEACRQAREGERLLAAVAAARRAREEAEWRKRLFEEFEEVDHGKFTGYEDLEKEDETTGGDWVDAIARQAAERASRASAANRAAALAAARARAAEAAAAAAAQEVRAKAAAEDSSASAQNPARPTAQDAEEAREMAEEARLSARALDEARWAELEKHVLDKKAESGAELCLQQADLPWPSGPTDNPLRVDAKSHAAVLRSQLRAGLLRWHPDKFEQKFGRFLSTDGGERAAILDRVKALAQQLNRQMDEMLPSASRATGSNP